MMEVVKGKVIKLLDFSIIYPIFGSPWVSPIQCVPKKEGTTIMENEKNELIIVRKPPSGICVLIIENLMRPPRNTTSPSFY